MAPTREHSNIRQHNERKLKPTGKHRRFAVHKITTKKHANINRLRAKIKELSQNHTQQRRALKEVLKVLSLHQGHHKELVNQVTELLERSETRDATEEQMAADAARTRVLVEWVILYLYFVEEGWVDQAIDNRTGAVLEIVVASAIVGLALLFIGVVVH